MAISSLRTLTTVNEQYRTRFDTYAPCLQNLSEGGYIDHVLASGSKGAYEFVYTGESTEWSCQANPGEPEEGDRYFFADQTGILRFSTTGPASAGDTPID